MAAASGTAAWPLPNPYQVLPPFRQVMDETTPCADLLGGAAAGLSAVSIVFRSSDPAYAQSLLSKAKTLYAYAPTTQ
jgi:Glycosyl hydrolase family 9